MKDPLRLMFTAFVSLLFAAVVAFGSDVLPGSPVDNLANGVVVHGKHGRQIVFPDPLGKKAAYFTNVALR